MQEWLDAIFSMEWLLGFSMGVATKAMLQGVRSVIDEFTSDRSDVAASRGRN